MSSKSLAMMAVGDLILAMPQAESFFALSAPALRSADVTVGNVDIVFTTRGVKTVARAFPPCDPANMKALVSAGFDVVSLAGNHTFDSGEPGIVDTLEGLRELGIATVGAGTNIDEARRPAIVERDGTRFGFLNYNCVGPEQMWASADKPGCAYVQVFSHYVMDYDSPGGTPTAYTFAEPRSLAAMCDDIRKLRPLCDVLVVLLHKGIAHIPVKLAAYDQQVSHAAIDSGADLVLGTHAHILKGIEHYKGKMIFHGLGHFVSAAQMLTVDPTPSLRQWQKKRKELFGFEPDPEYPLHNYHPEARQTMIAKCTIEDGRISRMGYLPCLINKQAQPEILKNDDRGRRAFEYVERITREADLNVRYAWEGDEVVVHPE